MTDSMNILEALLSARSTMEAALPQLKWEEGKIEVTDDYGDKQTRTFQYPAATDLKREATLALAKAGLLLIVEEASVRASDLTVECKLYQATTKDFMTLRMVWPVESNRGLSKQHAAAAALSHAWRHAVMQWLEVRPVPPGGDVPPAPGGFPTPAQLDAEVGELPTWADPAPVADAPAVPPMAVRGDEQWQAIGAGIEEDPPLEVHDTQHVLDVWSKFVASVPSSTRPAGVMFAYRKYSGDDKAQLVPDDAGFKAWLRAQMPAGSSP